MEIITEIKKDFLNKTKDEYPGMSERLTHIENHVKNKRLESLEPVEDSTSTIYFCVGFGTALVLLLWVCMFVLFAPWVAGVLIPSWVDWLLLIAALITTGAWCWALKYSKVI